jgi:hypothetical protein
MILRQHASEKLKRAVLPCEGVLISLEGFEGQRHILHGSSWFGEVKLLQTDVMADKQDTRSTNKRMIAWQNTPSKVQNLFLQKQRFFKPSEGAKSQCKIAHGITYKK